jgi:hypothetical protein
MQLSRKEQGAEEQEQGAEEQEQEVEEQGQEAEEQEHGAKEQEQGVEEQEQKEIASPCTFSQKFPFHKDPQRLSLLEKRRKI